MSSRGVLVDWQLENVDSVRDPLDCEEHSQSVYVRRKVVLEARMALWRVHYRSSLVRGSCVVAWLTTTTAAVRHSNSGSYFYFRCQTRRRGSACCWLVYNRSTCLFPKVWIIMVGGGVRSPHHVTKLKTQVFWNMTLCLWASSSRHFKGSWCLHM